MEKHLENITVVVPVETDHKVAGCLVKAMVNLVVPVPHTLVVLSWEAPTQ